MPHVRLRDVQARYELLSVRDYNLKRRVLQIARREQEQVKIIDALRAVSLDLEEGSRLGLVGANGAGKSTLLSIMAGLLPPSSGRVEIHGRVLALLGGAGAGMDAEATGIENIISMGVQLGELPAAMKGHVDDVVEFSGLGGRASDPVYSYSSGMQSRLRFSILTSLRPDVLLIDEGIGTADAAFAAKAGERLQQFVSGAGIVVLASHGDDLLRQQCDQALWLDRGAVRAQGALDVVLSSYHRSYEVHTALSEG